MIGQVFTQNMQFSMFPISVIVTASRKIMSSWCLGTFYHMTILNFWKGLTTFISFCRKHEKFLFEIWEEKSTRNFFLRFEKKKKYVRWSHIYFEIWDEKKDESKCIILWYIIHMINVLHDVFMMITILQINFDIADYLRYCGLIADCGLLQITELQIFWISKFVIFCNTTNHNYSAIRVL